VSFGESKRQAAILKSPVKKTRRDEWPSNHFKHLCTTNRSVLGLHSQFSLMPLHYSSLKMTEEML